jgi:hypothetical protein
VSLLALGPQKICSVGYRKMELSSFTVAPAPSPPNNLIFVKEIEFSSVLCIVTIIYVTVANVFNIQEV